MKIFSLLSLAGLLLAGLLVAAEEEWDWESWKKKYGKQYVDAATEQKRHQIWMDNLDFITEHNSNADKHGFTLGMNHLADLTNEEFREKCNGYKKMPPTISNSKAAFKTNPEAVIGAEVDWRKEGAVTEVKNQGQCGACWAFSATGSLEGQHFLKTGDLVSLSEQNLMDCSRAYGNKACNGGLMDAAFRYIIANGGIDTEENYPYLGINDTCHFNASTVGATMTSYRDIESGNVSALTEAIHMIGPISVAMDSSHLSFQLYKAGVYNESQCSSTAVNHGVLAVGYGTYNGEPYFLVKNSWGTEWGMDGYFMISRGPDNMCGLASLASYPIV